MTSKKFEKYMNMYQERNYAPKDRKVEKSDLGEYCDRSKCGTTTEASSGDCFQQSREEQEEVNPVLSLDLQEIKKTDIEWYDNCVQPKDSFVINPRSEDESIREEDVGKTHQEGRQGIQESDQRRCETEETSIKIQGEKMKKQTAKERKHEAKETKAYEKKEDKKESKSKKQK